jgi:hypothetical protein
MKTLPNRVDGSQIGFVYSGGGWGQHFYVVYTKEGERLRMDSDELKIIFEHLVFDAVLPKRCTYRRLTVNWEKSLCKLNSTSTKSKGRTSVPSGK